MLRRVGMPRNLGRPRKLGTRRTIGPGPRSLGATATVGPGPRSLGATAMLGMPSGRGVSGEVPLRRVEMPTIMQRHNPVVANENRHSSMPSSLLNIVSSSLDIVVT